MSNSSNQMRGKVYRVTPTQVSGDQGQYKKKLLILEVVDNPMYPQHIPFELNGRSPLFSEHFVEGEEITVHYNFRGREYDKKDGTKGYFLSLQPWKAFHHGKGEGGGLKAKQQEPVKDFSFDDDPPF
jgi:hypothetical protein